MGAVLKPVTRSAVEYLCWNMREIDRAEIFGIRSHSDPSVLAKETAIIASYGKAIVIDVDNRPAAILGVSPMWAGVWSAWSFGTDQWTRAAPALTRYGLKHIGPYLRSRAHRLQCESRVDHLEAHQWLRRLGAVEEGYLTGYGRDGSDYILFAWRK